VQVATQLAFETGYRVGAESNPSNKTVYVDGIVTNYCFVDEETTIEVRAEELVEVVTNKTVADFEGAWLLVDVPLEYTTSYAKAGATEWIKIKDGVAAYSFSQSMPLAQSIGVRYVDAESDPPLTGGRDIELRRRKLVFVERTDADKNDIPDFWEERHGLVKAVKFGDADGDGQSNWAEFVADTDPRDQASRLIAAAAVPGSKPEIRIPHSSRDRTYRLEYCTELTGPDEDAWDEGGEARGTGAALAFDLSDLEEEQVMFFRIRVDHP
jgi:hypothetical protein